MVYLLNMGGFSMAMLVIARCPLVPIESRCRGPGAVGLQGKGPGWQPPIMRGSSTTNWVDLTINDGVE